MKDLVRVFRSTPNAVLLVVQLLSLLLYPSLEHHFVGRSLTAALSLGILAATLFAVRATPMLTWVAGVLALPATVLIVIEIATADQGLLPWTSAFEAALYLYATVAMLRYMLADDHVTRDDLFAVGAVFTLLAWAFANLYVVVQAVWPGSFTAAVQPHEPRTWFELLFLSFTTLSSTGLSDVVPVKSHARSVVMLEQVAGVFYLGMVVTRLVAARMSVRSASDGEESAG